MVIENMIHYILINHKIWHDTQNLRQKYKYQYSCHVNTIFSRIRLVLTCGDFCFY